MKKLFFLLLSCAALGAEQITLDTTFIDQTGTASSLYEKPELASHAGGLEPHWHQEVSITVHVKVSDLLGAEQMQPGARYRVDEIAWIGHPQGWFVGGTRSVRLANGREYTIMPGIDRGKDGNMRVRRAEDAVGLCISAEDQLELTLQWRNPSRGGIYMRYFNAAEGCRITGTAMNLTPQGNLAGGNAEENYYNNKWRFNCPAIRIKASKVAASSEIDLKHIYLALEICAFIILLFLYLKARRRAQ